MNPNRLDTLRIVGPPETNKVMAAELSRLSRRAISRVPEKPNRPGSGTLVYPLDEELAWVATRYHRTSARVLWDLYRLDSKRLEPLYDEVLDAFSTDSFDWIAPGGTLSIDVRNVDAFAAGGRQIVGAVKNGIVDAATKREIEISVDPDHPDVRLWVRGQDEHLNISVDLTGGPRHLRGYRLEAGAAPLREPMAAAMVMLARWDARSEVLIDPMCGSGTIVIEAALMAGARPLVADVGELPMTALPRFQEIGRRAALPLFDDTWPICLGSDSNDDVVRAAVGNAERAGVSESASFRTRDFRELRLDDLRATAQRAGRELDRGVILSNPPYGRRLQPEGLLDLYADLGRFCSRFRGWRGGFLVGHPDFLYAFGHDPRMTKPMRTGSLRVNFYLFEF